MTDKIFDDFMRDKLRNHASPVPAGLWERIEKEQKRRPVGFFWSNRMLTMGLLLAIVATIGGLIWWKSSDNAQQAVSLNKENIINNQEQPNNSQSIASNKQEEQNTKATNGNNSIAANIDATVTNSSNTTTQASNNIDITSKNNLAEKKNVVVKKEQADANNIQQNATANQLLITANKRRTNRKYSSAKAIPATEQSINANNNQSGFEDNEKTIDYSYNPSLHRSKGLLAGIDKKAFSFSDKSTPQLKTSIPSIVDCPSSNGNKRNDWYLEMYASPDYTFKNVKGGTASTAYLQKKDSTESMQVGYTAGFRITKSIGEHFLLKAGLQFSQINERFTLRTENERKTTTITTTRDIVDASGNVTTVTETSTYTQIGYLERVSNNQYRSIELPVMLGYEFGNDKLKASINGGIIANLASWYKGKTLDTAYQSISLSKSSDGNIYSHSVGIGLYGSISIIKPLTEKLDIFAEPYFRYSLSQLNSGALGYTQRFSTAGISLGIRYKFNNSRQRY